MLKRRIIVRLFLCWKSNIDPNKLNAFDVNYPDKTEFCFRIQYFYQKQCSKPRAIRFKFYMFCHGNGVSKKNLGFEQI